MTTEKFVRVVEELLSCDEPELAASRAGHEFCGEQNLEASEAAADLLDRLEKDVAVRGASMMFCVYDRCH